MFYGELYSLQARVIFRYPSHVSTKLKFKLLKAEIFGQSGGRATSDAVGGVRPFWPAAGGHQPEPQQAPSQ